MGTSLLGLRTKVALVLALAAGAALWGSFLAARRTARVFFRETAAMLRPVEISFDRRWLLRSPLSSSERPGGPWIARACETELCDVSCATIWLSATGHVVATSPPDLSRRIAEITAHRHQTSYLLWVPVTDVRRLLPASGDHVVVAAEGDATLISLGEDFPARARSLPPQLARFEALLRATFPERTIMRADDIALRAGLREAGLVRLSEFLAFNYPGKWDWVSMASCHPPPLGGGGKRHEASR